MTTAEITRATMSSVECCIRVSRVITVPASTARKKERQETPRWA
jgi:hypothetical protein